MLAIWTHISAASGKLNGVVAARNRGGNYLREYVVPVDPETTRQVNCRDAMAALWNWWSQTMTAAQRTMWENYSHEHERTGRLGVRRELPGWQAFCRQHYHKFQALEQLGTSWDPGTAPPIYPSNYGTIPTLARQDADNFLLTFMDDAPWQFDQDNGLIVYVSAIQPITRNFFKGPYRLIYDITGDPDDGLEPPYPVPSPFELTGPGRVWYRIFYVSNDQERAGPFEGRIDLPA